MNSKLEKIKTELGQIISTEGEKPVLDLFDSLNLSVHKKGNLAGLKGFAKNPFIGAKDIIELIPTLFAISTFDDGVYCYVNSAFTQITGYSYSEVIGRSSIDLGIVAPGQRIKVTKAFKKGKLSNFHSSIQTKEGKTIPGLFSAIVFNDGGEKYLYTTFTDLSSQKDYQLKLEESESRYQTMIANHVMPILLIDPENGQILEANNKASDFYGYTLDEFRGLNIHDINRMPKSELQKLMQDAKTFNRNYFQFKHHLKNGEVKDVEVHSGMIDMNGRQVLLSAITDITDRIRMQRELKESEQNLKAIHEATSDVYFLIAPDYSIIGFNNKSVEYAKMIRNKELRAGDSMLDYSDPDSIDAFKMNFKKALTGEKIEVEKEIKGRNGESYWFEVTYIPVRNAGGNIYSIAFNSKEITGKKRAETQLKRINFIIENSPVSVFLSKNVKGFPIEIVSENIVRLCGYTAHEFRLGKVTYKDLICPEDQSNFEAEINDAVLSNAKSIEHKPYRIRDKKGNHKWIKDVTTLYCNHIGEVAYFEGVVYDITDQQESKRALQINENRMQAAMQASEIGMWDWDLETGIVYYGPGWANILGYNRSEFTNDFSFWEKLVHPLDREKTIEEVNHRLESGTGFQQIEHRMRRKDNRYIWVRIKGSVITRNDAGKPTRAVGTLEDIHFKKRVEIALVESEHRFKNVLSQMHFLGVILNKKGQIVFINNAFLMLTGYKENEVMAKNWFDEFVDDAKREELKNQYLKAICKKVELPEKIKYHIKTKNGRIVSVNWSNTITNNHQNRFDSFTLIGENITEKEKALEDLKESEEKFRTMFNSTSDALFIHEPDGNFVEVNESACKLLNYSRRELLMFNPLDVTYYTSEDRFFDDLRDLTENRSLVFNHQLITKDNELIPVEIHSAVFSFKGKDLIVSAVRDLTERESLELRIKEVTNIIEKSPIITMLVEIGEKMNIRLVSSNFERILGYSPDDFISGKRTFDDIIYSVDLPNLEHDIRSGLNANMLSLNLKPYRVITKEQSIKWFKIELNYRENINNVRSIEIILLDITQQETNRIALRNSEERLQMAMDATGIGLWDWDYTNGSVYYSPGYKKIVGFQNERVKPSVEFWESRIHPEDKKNTLNTLKEHIEGKTESYYNEHRLKHRNGNWVWIQGKGKVIFRDINNKPLRIIGTMEKLSKKIYNTIITTEEKERKRFAENLHDDLGPLLSAAKLYLEAIRLNKKINITDEVYTRFNQILTDAIRSSQEIANNISPHILKNFGLESALRAFCQKIAESKLVMIDLNFGFSGRLSEEIEISLYRVFIELINNTIKHAKAKHIEISIRENNGHLIINYNDNGIGFDVNDAFEKQKGMGLNNILSRIEIINGKCLIESNEGIGTSININIPVQKVI